MASRLHTFVVFTGVVVAIGSATAAFSSSASSCRVGVQVVHRPAPFSSSFSSSSFSRRRILDCDLLARQAASSTNTDLNSNTTSTRSSSNTGRRLRRVAVIGAGWGGLSAAHALSQQEAGDGVQVTVIEASPRVGGLVRDGFTTQTGRRPAEAGQHGFWNNYHNIYNLFRHDIRHGFSIEKALTDYAEQGQYSPNGLEAVWPVYRDQPITLPTGLAQAAFTRFLNLPLQDLISAAPLVLAFSDFDDSPEAWERYDAVSFRDLCIKLGVSRRCYDEAFEPMILTGLFAPGSECSAAAALGMAYFFVLQSQNAFDVQWCRGNIGQTIFDPWVETMKDAGVQFQCDIRVTGFQFASDNNNNDETGGNQAVTVTQLECTDKNGAKSTQEVDDVIFAVGAKALNAFARFCPELATFPEFQGFANLRGTSVLATRLFLDKNVTVPYTANACFGFDRGVGMTMFDIGAIHGRDATTVKGSPGSVIEVDYYHASRLLVMEDKEIVAKAKADLDVILGGDCRSAKVVDAAVVKLPDGVNWYFPGSYADMPNLQSQSVSNMYFAGDIVKTRHGSWSQEKAFVTGIQAANLLLGRPRDQGIVPLAKDETHVKLGRDLFSGFRKLLSQDNNQKSSSFLSLVDFWW